MAPPKIYDDSQVSFSFAVAPVPPAPSSMTEFSETDVEPICSLIVQSVSLLERRGGASRLYTDCKAFAYNGVNLCVKICPCVYSTYHRVPLLLPYTPCMYATDI